MSLPAPYSEVYLEGDGVTTEFAFGTNFKPISAGLVKCIVYLEDGYAVVPTYTVNMAVGSITISALTKPDSTVLTAPPLGSTVRIFRDEPEAQPVSASQIQSYTSKQLEILFDAIVAMIQEVSYTVDHKTIRLTEPQRDISLQKLTDLVDGHLIYWDAIKRELVVTNYPQQDVVQCVSGLFFKIETDPNTHNPYLEWSTDNSDWHAINVDAAQALAQDAYTLADSAYNLASTTRGELNAHKANHANPHETSMANLIDTDFNNLVSGQFLTFDGIKWKNVNYSATYAWGGIGGNINDQTDLKNALDAKVSTDGSSIMRAPLKFMAGSMRGAVGPYLNGVGFWKLDSQGNLTQIASLSDSQFFPTTTNAITLGNSTRKWKDLYLAGKAYVATLNNGADLTVPNKTGTLATMADVELAANSGRMITDQGVWYAKMDAQSTAPAAADGTNYADFTQVDGNNNPIIVIYERQSGAWVQTETITPPAEYDGYVPITSKIWDIAEQTGQQGGRILWNHTSKEFTPYPQIISFEDIEVTGDSTVIMPQNPGVKQIVNKEYVDDAIASIPTPTVDAMQSIDAIMHVSGGNPAINGSIVSGFGNSSYLELPGVFKLGATNTRSFEINCAFITQATEDTNKKVILVGYAPNQTVDLNPGGVSIRYGGYVGQKIEVLINGANSTQTITGTTDLLPATKYYVKIEYDGTNYKLWLSTDGSAYTLEASDARTVLPAPAKFCIGRNLYHIESVDMSGWNISKNEQMIWAGMDAPGLCQRVATGHEVIAFQAPTVDNNYTWYRKYADGWVEQGGTSHGSLSGAVTVNLPVTMADTNYKFQATPDLEANDGNVRVVFCVRGQRNNSTVSTVNVIVTYRYANTNDYSDIAFDWEVKGMAA